MSKPDPARFNRRQTLGLIAGLPLLAAGTRAQAKSDITFDELDASLRDGPGGHRLLPSF